MKSLIVTNFRELMNGQKKATIRCLITNAVVRTLTVNGDLCHIHAGDETDMDVALRSEITYEPWMLDRGSMLFGKNWKICTEGDIITFENGEEYSINPKI